VRAFSANLGTLWTDLPLPDAICAAADAGFDAVEFHYPYDWPAHEIALVLRDAGVPCLGLNTRPGREGELGLAAVPGQEARARAHIDAALDYAEMVGARHVHVLAGLARGGAARAAFRGNLIYAANQAAARGLRVLIEPLNGRDVPGYHMARVDEAAAILRDVGHPALGLMFDVFHILREEQDPVALFRSHRDLVGHIQFANVPHRTEPLLGEADLAGLLKDLEGLGWQGVFGAEYLDGAPSGGGLAWLEALRG
jgi:hydroxypyruvate isomerase